MEFWCRSKSKSKSMSVCRSRNPIKLGRKCWTVGCGQPIPTVVCWTQRTPQRCVCSKPCLFVFPRGSGRRHGLAEQFPVTVVSGIADLMSGGIITENNFAHYALVFGQMGFFEEMITRVVFVLQDKSKLFLWPKDFATQKSSILIQIPSNFFPHLPILARGSGDAFVIGRIIFVNGARPVGIEHDADANIAAGFLS
jgi:hypothetical protein